MAQNTEVDMRLCLEWNTKRPDPNGHRSSSYFSFMEETWSLDLSCVGLFPSKKLLYNVHLRPKAEKLKVCFQTTTFFESTVGIDSDPASFASLGYKTIVQKRNSIIWSFDAGEIVKTLPRFADDGSEWRFVCVFQTAHVITEGENEMIVLSDRDDWKLPFMNLIPTDLESLSLDFSNLLKNKVFPDVELRCGGRTIGVHKAILAVRSKVLAKMFTGNISEAGSSVNVRDMNDEVLNAFLDYLYSGKLQDHLSEDSMALLYAVSEQYAVYALKKACSDRMIRSLTLENCLNFLTIADEHKDVVFIDAVARFICNNNFLENKTWLSFCEERPKLANGVYQIFYRDVRDRFVTERNDQE